MEAIRPDEEPVLKTGGGEEPLVGSSPTASAFVGLIATRSITMEAIRTVEEPAWKAGGGRHVACGFEPGTDAKRWSASAERRHWGHGPTGRRQHRTLEIRVRLPVTPLPKHGPVAQRRRQHPYKVTTGGSKSAQDYFGPDTPMRQSGPA